MSCLDCEAEQDKVFDRTRENGRVAYFRWKTANLAVIGCEEHLREVFEVLRAEIRRQAEEHYDTPMPGKIP